MRNLVNVGFLATLLCSSIALTACDKSADKATTSENPASAAAIVNTASATNNTATATTTTTTTTTTTSSQLSPTMEYWVMGNRAGVMQMLSQKHPNMTAEQKTCLKSPEGNANYTKELEPYVANILTPEEMKQSDEFYASAAGKKFMAVMQSQINGEPLPKLTEADQKDMMAITTQPFMQKVQREVASADKNKAMAMVMKIADAEVARCKIS